jgi:RimJ/RimL family protein N-acetyltransferase
VTRELRLPMERAVVEAIAEDAEAHSDGYEVVTWRDRCPPDLAEDRALMAQKMSTDVPREGLEWYEESWDASRIREMEALVASMNRTLISAGAIDASTGRLVAFTDIAVPLGAPEVAYQWDTLVLEEHRGHRLGMLVKTANLDWLRRESPRTQRIVTENAETNLPMISINEALGFEVVGHRYAWQKRLSRGRSGVS